MTDLHALLREARAYIEIHFRTSWDGLDLRDALLARIDAALAEPQWRPIETAPKDGTQLLLVSEDGVQVVGYWGKHNHVPLYGWLRPVELYGEEVDGLDPTHWMPLPEKP